MDLILSSEALRWVDSNYSYTFLNILELFAILFLLLTEIKVIILFIEIKLKYLQSMKNDRF